MTNEDTRRIKFPLGYHLPVPPKKRFAGLLEAHPPRVEKRPVEPPAPDTQGS